MTRRRLRVPAHWRAVLAVLTHPDPRTSLWAQALNLPPHPPTDPKDQP